jgi:pyruvate,orthophosphate dikinase
MQVRAVCEAAIACIRDGIDIQPQIMVPLVSHVNELRAQRETVEKAAREVANENRDVDLTWQLGTMIETPRAAMTANEIATVAEFFSFGTNDLTQTTFGLSRDDSASFLPDYMRQGIFERDPFVTIDPDGVGALIKIAVEKGRATRPGLKLGICGEHGGDPDSIHFVEGAGLDYVSCSPYRTPIARLAAAQAKLQNKGGGSTA